MTSQEPKIDQGLSYGLAEKSDWPDIVRLQQKIYPHHHWSMDYVRWEYGRNPAGSPQVWIARKDGELIASYAAVPFRTHIKGREGLSWRMEHLLTHPEYRSYGSFHTFSSLSRKFLSEIKNGYGFAFPNDRSYPGFKATGWKTVCPIPLYVLSGEPLEEQKAARHFAGESVDHFEASASKVWKMYARHFDFTLDRNMGYLNWRYFERPGVSYEVRRIKEGRGTAYLVLKTYIDHDGKKWAHICDFFEDGENDRLCLFALEEAACFASRERCFGLSLWWAAEKRMLEALKTRKFVLRKEPVRNFVVFASAEMNKLIDSGENLWNIAMGDTDIF